MKQKETAAVLMVLLAAACWGANGIFINILTAYGVNGTQMTLVRMASMAILTGIWLAAKNPAALKIDLRDLVWFVPAGALGLFMFGLFYTYSIQLVGMGTAAVLIYLMPSLVMLFSVVFLHEKFTPGKGLCLVLSLLGCALVSGVAGGVTLDAGGVAYGLGAALCYTLQNILLATKLKKYSPMTNLFYMFLFSAAASLVFTAAAGELPGVAYILTTPGALAANLGLGLVCSLAAQWLYTAALKTIPASRASIAATFEPVAAALFGLVLFGQKMDGFGVARHCVRDRRAGAFAAAGPRKTERISKWQRNRPPRYRITTRAETYKNADAETRRNLHRYKSELNITDEQMNWADGLGGCAPDTEGAAPQGQCHRGNDGDRLDGHFFTGRQCGAACVYADCQRILHLCRGAVPVRRPEPLQHCHPQNEKATESLPKSSVL